MTNPGNGHGGPDWDSIFSQARRRVFARVAVVAAIAGVGSLFLLGGGLSAQGTVTWKNVFGQPGDARSDTEGTCSEGAAASKQYCDAPDDGGVRESQSEGASRSVG